MIKTGRSYSNLELNFNKKDKTKYKKAIKAKTLEYPDEEEMALLNEDVKNLPLEEREALKSNIENIPEKIKKGFYGIFEGLLYPLLPLAPDKDRPIYGFEIQNVRKIDSPKKSNLESLSKRLSEKFYNNTYKKALSTIIHTLPL